MVKFDKKWEWEIGAFLTVEPIDQNRLLGVLSGNMKKLSIYCVETQKKLYHFVPEQRRNIVGAIIPVGNHILIEEKMDKSVWYSLDIETGESTRVKGLSERHYFAFNIEGYSVFNKGNRPWVTDPARAKSLTSKGDNLDGLMIGRGMRGRYSCKRETNGKVKYSSYLGKVSIDSGVAYFGDEIKLEGLNIADGFVNFCYNKHMLVFHYKGKRSRYCAFTWEGKLIGEICMRELVEKYGRNPRGYAVDKNTVVFQFNDENNQRHHFVAVDARVSKTLWELKLDDAVYSNVYTRAGNYLVNPLGKGVLQKERDSGNYKLADTCMTRIIDMATGELNLVYEDIGKHIVGTDHGIYYKTWSNEEVLGYGKFV